MYSYQFQTNNNFLLLSLNFYRVFHSAALAYLQQLLVHWELRARLKLCSAFFAFSLGSAFWILLQFSSFWPQRDRRKVGNIIQLIFYLLNFWHPLASPPPRQTQNFHFINWQFVLFTDLLPYPSLPLIKACWNYYLFFI